MTRSDLISQIRHKKSCLCIGLDPDLSKLPLHLSRDAKGVKEFCLDIIASTLPYCVSYKLNAAFFESLGWRGYQVMEEVIADIPKTHFIIADAKRGDIGNTSSQYAKAFFETMTADAITIAPYMGEDSVKPFLNYPDKWGIILGLTSNPGSKDFELLDINGHFLYERVLDTCSKYGSIENTMFVIGATQGIHMDRIRKLLPNHFFLVPGVGAQGGSLEDVCTHLMNDDIGILINSSREIIYASNHEDFAISAANKASAMHDLMKTLIP